MSTSVVLPALGESVTEGTVTRWLKKVGDTVEADEGLLEISTDKVDTEIPSPVSGVIEEILVQEDETVEVGAVLAKIGDGPDPRRPPMTRRPRQSRARRRAARGRAARRRAPRPRPPRSPRPPRLPAPAAEAPAAGRHAAAPPASGGKDVVLPELGESVTEGTVTRWLKQRRRQRRGRRAAARDLDRQGRHRDPVALRRRPAGDPRPGGRDGRRRLRARPHRRQAPRHPLSRAGSCRGGSGRRGSAPRQAAPAPRPAPAARPARPHPPLRRSRARRPCSSTGRGARAGSCRPAAAPADADDSDVTCRTSRRSSAVSRSSRASTSRP